MIEVNSIFSTIEQVQVLNDRMTIYIGKPSLDFFKGYVLDHDKDFYEPLSGRIDIDTFVDKVHTLSTTFVLVQDGEVAGLIASYFYDLSSKKGFITLTHTSVNLGANTSPQYYLMLFRNLLALSTSSKLT